jgi:hypothetical protein
MAQQAKPDLPVDHDRAAALRIAAHAGERSRNCVAHDHIGSQRRFGESNSVGQDRAGEDREHRPAGGAVETLSQKSHP